MSRARSLDARLQRRVQRYGWDRAADDYDRSWSRQLEPAQRLTLERAGLRDGERVLDVACGTGLVSLPAARAVAPTGELVGTDISQVMVDTSARVAEGKGVPNASFRRMDAESLEFEDESFDAVICALGLMYVPEPRVAVAEMRRVVRPSGRVVAAVWGARARCGWAGIFPVVDERVSSEVCPMFFQLGAGETLAHTFRAVGFEAVTTDRLSARLLYDTEREALAAAFAGGPVALAYSRFDDRTKAEAHAAYLETIADYRVGAGYDIPGEFVVVRGERPG